MTNANPARPASDAPAGQSEGWTSVINASPGKEFPEPWEKVFGPLRAHVCAIGQIGQSIDGRVATPTGHSHYINGPAGLAHLHRLRALVDAVVVGIGTAIADDPQLTVRRVEGRSPARAVIDPNGRLSAGARLLRRDGSRRIVIVKSDTRPNLPADVDIVALPPVDGQLAPAEILAALRKLGLNRVLIEGGANTVSRFLAANCLDRLHVMVAPIVLGSGPTGISLPPIERADEAMRPPVHVHQLGDEVLFDCDLSAQRFGGNAKKST